MMNPKELGELGERIACEYLVKKGFKILERNHRITFGEIDIIARKKWRLFSRNDKTIHFVEVKTIMDNHDGFSPEGKVGYFKQKKLRRLAEIWLQKSEVKVGHPYQIDVIGIMINEVTKNATVHFFGNAIQETS